MSYQSACLQCPALHSAGLVHIQQSGCWGRVYSQAACSWHTTGEEADAPECRAANQRDLERLEKGTDKNLMQFNKGKRKVLHLKKNKLSHQCMLGTPIWKAAVQTPKVMVDPRLTYVDLEKCPWGQVTL